jgi:hypothetical protein
MKTTLRSLLMILISSGLAISVQAATLQMPCTMTMMKTGEMLVQSLSNQGSPMTLEENEDIGYAELSFHDDLAPGTEIEVWPAVQGDVPPWEIPGDQLHFGRNIWITDDRTGDLVRFDVTGIAGAWQREELPNLGFVLRITAPESEEGLEQAQVSGLAGAKDISLVYHVGPVKPPKHRLDRVRDDPPSGKTPRSEDQSEKPE